jgi:hypothetical protein
VSLNKALKHKLNGGHQLSAQTVPCMCVSPIYPSVVLAPGWVHKQLLCNCLGHSHFHIYLRFSLNCEIWIVPLPTKAQAFFIIKIQSIDHNFYRETDGLLHDHIFLVFYGFNSRWCHWIFSFLPAALCSWGQIFSGEYRRQVSRADNLTIFACRVSSNLGVSTSRNPQGLSRTVLGLLYLLLSSHLHIIVQVIYTF